MSNLEIKVVRLSESNQNYDEALKGQYGQYSDGKGIFTIIKNILFINLLPGASYNSVKLPTVYDGFLICSNGTRIHIKDSLLTCNLANNISAQGQLILKKWN